MPPESSPAHCDKTQASPHPSIFQKRFRPACADVIRNQKSRSAQSCAKLCGFSARCGAKVKHPVSFPNRQRRRRAHGAWLLQIIQPCMVIRMLGRAFCHVIIKSRFAPRHRSKRKYSPRRHFLCGKLQRVHAQSVKSLLVKRGEICVIFLPQKCFHCFGIF